MKKKPVEVNVRELEEILNKYLGSDPGINYALKIVGHPGVGKSAVVQQAAKAKNYYFIDTRLAFKENVDLGGYPVPDNVEKRMIYYRPKFIPPADIPEGYDGIVWFLDESNRAHPTVIQTLFQIITDRKCGEHALPEKTYIVLAGNLGEEDSTTITDFDDSALDGRLVIVQLKPTAADWLRWAHRENIHDAVVQYISIFPEKLWDEQNINPNPRGWHQVSQAIVSTYGIGGNDSLQRYFRQHEGGTLEKIIISLVGRVAGIDFTSQITHPRLITTRDVLAGDNAKLSAMQNGEIPSEDVLWAVWGALNVLRDEKSGNGGNVNNGLLHTLANVLKFIGFTRTDRRISFLYTLLTSCGMFTKIPQALGLIDDDILRKNVESGIEDMLSEQGE